MKVYALAPNENWICDRQVEEFNKYFSEIATKNIHEADVIWLVANWCYHLVPRNLLKTKKVVTMMHHVDPTKFDSHQQAIFKDRDSLTDVYNVPNEFTKQFIEQYTTKPIYVVGCWYDPNVWNLEMSHYDAKNYFNIPTHNFVIGSFQKDTEANGQPKLSKGPDVFCDYVERVATSNTHVLLSGYRRSYVINRLQEAGIKYTYREKVSIDDLKIMYRACNLYVVGSRCEGGPQAILEAPALQVPIVSSYMGMAPMVLDKHCIIDFKNEFYKPTLEDVTKNFNNVQKFNILNIKEEYIKIFNIAYKG